MDKRLKREYTIKDNDYKIVYGTFNRLNPESLYLRIGTWIKYVGSQSGYQEKLGFLIDKIKYSIKNNIRVNKNINPNFLLVSNFKKNNTSEKHFYITLDITLLQNKGNVNELKTLEPELNLIKNGIIDIINSNSYFEKKDGL